MSDDSKNLSRVEDILSGEDYIPTKPMSRIEKLLLEGGGPGGKLPEVTSDDNGKILKVKDGAWDKGEDISGDKLPQVSSQDNGKVLKVVNGEWNIDKDEGDRLPTVTSSDNGKVLTVKNGAWDKDDPKKELPETTSEDSGKALMVNNNGDWAKGDIPDPAITAEASGDIASFSDGANLPMPKLQVGIEPVQDLHGLSYPWVGGTGKNKLPNRLNTITKNGITVTKNSNGTYTLNGTCTSDNTDFYINAENGASVVDDRISLPNGEYKLSGISNGTSSTYRLIVVVYNSTASYISLYSGEVSFTIEDNVSCAVFLRVMSGQTFNNFVISPMICSTTETSTFEPYSNICPISGHTEANVTRCGKNLLNVGWESGSYGSVGNKIADSNRIRTIYTVNVKPNVTYTLSFQVPRSSNGLICYYTDDSFISRSGFLSTFTTPEGCTRIAFAVSVESDSTNPIAQLETGIIETAYEPYNGQTYNIQFTDGSNPLTVYGGSLDVVSGELVVDRAYVDLGTLNWGYASTQKIFFDNLPTNALNVTNKNGLCEGYKPTTQQIMDSSTWTKVADGEFVFAQNLKTNGRCAVVIKNLNYTDATEFKNSLSNMKIVYPLATPITYQLTPTEVKSLLGSNNVCTDTGEIESLIYYKQNAEDIADLIETLDEKVKQTPTNDGVYDILLSGSTAGSAEATEGAKKSSTHPLKYSTHGGILSIGDGDTNSGGVTLGWAGSPNVAVERTNQTTGAKNWIEMGLDDIVFNSNSSGTPKTWDGTHTSLKDAIAAAAGVGGCEAVYLPLADYEELTTAEKEDPTKIYFVINEGTKVSPTLSADDGNITTSSTASGYDPWKAFDGSTRTDNNDYEYCYAPWGQHNGEWIAYNFGTKHVFSKVHIRAATMRALTMKYYIEGSEDGETWTNLIANADYVSVSHPAYASAPSYVETDILLDTTKGKFSKIRFRQDLSIGYPYSGDRFSVANWDIYAAAASNKPSIYYKNVLYTPDELPTTTISDAGKVLKVNEDGLWDKGDIPAPNINSVQVPPVIFDNGSLKKVNDISGFPGLEKVYLSAEEYDALSSNEKNDLSKIYYISQYKYFSNSDNTMIVRRDANSDVWIFFNGWVYDPSAETNLPAGAEVYATEVGNSYGYSDPASQTRPVQNQPCWVRFNGTKASAEFASEYQIRNGKWYPDVAGVYTSPVYGKLKIGENVGSYTYSDPFDTGETISIYYGGKQYTEYEPAKPYVELTQSEYDALPSSKESDGIIYFING